MIPVMAAFSVSSEHKMHQINTELPLLKFCLGMSKNNFQLVDYDQRSVNVGPLVHIELRLSSFWVTVQFNSARPYLPQSTIIS